MLQVEERKNPMSASQDGDTKTILVVDDSVADRKLMSLVLVGEGYRVVEAGSGKEGLEVFKIYCDAIDLIVTDMMMPGMDGVEFIRNVRRLSSRPRVIFISGYQAQFMAEGSPQWVELVEKSDDMVRLTQKVREVLDNKGMILNVLNTVLVGSA